MLMCTCRFSKVAKMSDTSNLNIQIQIKTQFLSVGIIYGAYLVFKFCDSRMVSSEPYVNLKYKTSSGNFNAYIAEGRDDKWMMIELCRFRNHNQITDFDVLLKSFCGHSCGSGPIFIEGIEFRPIDNVSTKLYASTHTYIKCLKYFNYLIIVKKTHLLIKLIYIYMCNNFIHV